MKEEVTLQRKKTKRMEHSNKGINNTGELHDFLTF